MSGLIKLAFLCALGATLGGVIGYVTMGHQVGWLLLAAAGLTVQIIVGIHNTYSMKQQFARSSGGHEPGTPMRLPEDKLARLAALKAASTSSAAAIRTLRSWYPGMDLRTATVTYNSVDIAPGSGDEGLAVFTATHRKTARQTRAGGAGRDGGRDEQATIRDES
ncbi:hypothetical protein ACFSSC_02610 [Corynebacterium mendelii]|uniref:Uncharacterized protein n=1 Tax=Corynebacterium mendelii TaxID=2765362 RepID=A0A939DZK5_9CORY|nr:hypothetical protein [Corynebacterium mendelii]MBN9644170.1 hypothetical protein [Corynebacterium mendelii]